MSMRIGNTIFVRAYVGVFSMNTVTMRLLLLLLATWISNFSSCVGYRRFSSVVIYDPEGVSQYFSEMIQLAENRSRVEFKQWSIEEVKTQCFRALVDGAHFTILRKQESNHVSELDKFDQRLIHTKIHETFVLLEAEYMTPSIEIASSEITTVLELPTHFCAALEDGTEMVHFAIASAHHHDALFLLTKNTENLSDDKKFKFIAIIESIPTFDLEALRKEDMDMKYQTGSIGSDNSSEENKQETEEGSEENDYSFEDTFEDAESSKYHLCELDEFRTYRVCATAFTALMQFKDEVYRDIDYTIGSGKSCMRKEKILLNEVDRKVVEADLLACSILMDSSSLQIFLTNDPFQYDSVYLLERVSAQDEFSDDEKSVDDESTEVVVGYTLILHLENVLPLKRFEDEE